MVRSCQPTPVTLPGDIALVTLGHALSDIGHIVTSMSRL